MDMLGFDGGFLMPDFALGINPVPPKKKNHAKKIILFNVADYYGNSWPGKDVVKFKKYIDGMASLALFIRECYKFDELVIFNSNYPSDKQASLNLFEQLEGSNYQATIRIIEGRKSVGEIIQLGQTAEFAFTTRLHAGIIVAHGGCKLIGIAYQPKVKDVLEDAGVTPYVIDIKSILNGAGFESIVRDSLQGLNYNMITKEALKIDNALLSILEN
jgi:polysaccharide pyruvyl transferase WcaK-like protein